MLTFSILLFCNTIYMRRIIILLFLFTRISSGFGSNLDSLLLKLKTAKEDTNKVKLLLNIEDEYININPDSAFYYTEICNTLIDKLKDTAHIYDCNIGYMEYYYAKYNFEKSIEYAFKNLQIARKIKNQKRIARSLSNISTTYNRFGRYYPAVEYAIKTLKYSQQIGDTLNISTRYANIAWIYLGLRQYDKSIEYAEKGIIAGKKYNDVKGLLKCLNNAGVAYDKINKTDKSLPLYKMELTIGVQHNTPYNSMIALVNLCIQYYKRGNQKELTKYVSSLNDMLAKNKSLGDINLVGHIYGVNAMKDMSLYQYSSAEKNLKAGLELVKDDSNADAHLFLYEIYYKLKYCMNDIPGGEYYSYKVDSLNQKAFSDELAMYSMDLEAKYETQKKENEILQQQQQLKKRKNWNIILISSILILAALSFLLYRYLKQRNSLLEKEKIIQEQQIKRLEKEKQLEATEAILNGQEEERSRIAKDLHDGLGGLLSGVKYSLSNMKENVLLSSENALSFERTIDMLDSGIKELRRVSHNMMPENLVKFGLDTALKDYCSAITKTKALQVSYSSFGMEEFQANTNISVTVYRVIQELINNTMKHAGATASIVQLSKDEHKLHITVEDNGKGFDVKNITAFKGAGWTNIQNRITYLKGKIDVDSSEQNGTSVIIEIPLS